MFRHALVILAASLSWGSSTTLHASSRSVQFESAPAGAKVYLGEVVLCETTPCSAKLEDGTYAFVLDKDGYLPLRVETLVSQKRYKVRAALRLAATLDIRVGGEEASGAHVLCNGRQVGQVPLRVDVEPGPIELEIAKDGFVSFRQKFELSAANTARLDVSLVQSRGTLRVTSDIPRAAVVVDGRHRGLAPLEMRIPTGLVRIQVRSPAGRVVEREMEVREGEEHTFFARFKGASSASEGILIDANVPGAFVYLDDKFVGTTPYLRGPLPAGEHRLRVEAEGYIPYESRFDSNADQALVLMAELVALGAGSGTIDVKSSAVGAEVLIDGRYIGKAPLVLEGVSLGEHEVRVRALGYAEHTQRCLVERSQRCAVDALLKRFVEVSLSANVEGASLTIDGTRKGDLPFAGRLLEGNHLFYVEAEGYHPLEQDVHLDGMSDFTLRFELNPESEKEKRRRRRQSSFRGTSRFSGAPIAPERDTFTVDASVTMPAQIGLMANVGWVKGFSLGFGADLLERNVGLGLARFSVLAHSGVRFSPAWSAGMQAQASLGSSFTEAENTTFASLGRLLLSLHLGPRWVMSAESEFEYVADRWERLAPVASQRGEQRASRWLSGAAVVFWIEEEATALLLRTRWLVDGPAREVYRRAFFSLNDRDPEVYGQAGLVFRF